MVALCTFSVLPLVLVVFVSFSGEQYLRFPPASYGVDLYKAAWESEKYRDAVAYSGIVALIAALLAAVVGTMAAFAFTRYRSRTLNVVESTTFLPLLLPNLIIGVAILGFCISTGLPRAPYGLIAAQTLMIIPFVVRFVMSSLASLPRNVEPASVSLGASRTYTFRRVLFPLLAPGIVAGGLIAFLRAFDETDASIFLTAPGSVTLPVQLFNDFRDSAASVPVAVGAASIVLTAVVVLALDKTVGVLRMILGERR